MMVGTNTLKPTARVAADSSLDMPRIIVQLPAIEPIEPT